MNTFFSKHITIGRAGRSISLLALFLTISLVAKADPVDRARARQIASNFLNTNDVRHAELNEVSAEAGFSNVYVFSSENGFVLMAADDCVQPILGYSLTNKFDLDDMPDNKRAWIKEYGEQIQAAIDSHAVATPEVAREWRDLASSNPSRPSREVVVPPLIQTRWNQGAPYNIMCPGSAVTGCVATAMAQVMKHWNYPQHGIGSHTYTHGTYGSLTADFQNTNYNWANMTNTYSSGSTQTQKVAVATLMYHCGVSVEMDYSTSGSAASTRDVAIALKEYFNYSKDVLHRWRSSHSTNEWIALLKADLDLGRPLQYHGSGSGGGHSFVCDGYRDDNFFHFNWGWGGYCDDYYVVSNLNPGPGGIGSGSNGIYNDSQGAIFGVHPSPNNAIPLNLTYTLNGGNVTLNWNGGNGAVSYKVYCNGNLAGNTSSTTFTHTAPFGNVVYYVRSIDANDELSLSSNTVTVTVPYPTPLVNDLTANVSGHNVSLTWTAPDWCYPSTPTATLTYGNGSEAGGLGLQGNNNMYWGHRYTAASLNTYNNMRVYKVSFLARASGQYRVHIYQGSSSGHPQTQVHQQTFTVNNSGWNEIDLTNTVQIDATRDLWVFIYDLENRDYPASYCSHSGNEGNYFASNPLNSVTHSNGKAFNIRTFVSDGNYTYNLYRNGNSIANNLNTTTYTDNNLANGTYNYYVKTNYYAGQTAASNTVTVTIGGSMHEITATANPTEGGTVSGAGSYNHGQSCTLTATANTGYTFVNWTKNGTQVSTNANYTFTVTEAGNYVANFQSNSYSITATAYPTEGGTVSGAGSYNQGQSCTLTATANTGYTFVNWTKNGTQVSTNASYTFAVTEAGNYVANFQSNSYSITATAYPTEGGTVSGAGSYNHGQSCTLTATANTGYTFVNWTKNGTQVSTNASYTFAVTEDADYVANFEADIYFVTATANPTAGGTVTGAGTYLHGQSCTLTATAKNGYTFLNWTESGSVVSTSSAYTFTVTEDADYVANFEPEPVSIFEITAKTEPDDNAGHIEGVGVYNHGEICTLTATANSGFSFVHWTLDGVVVAETESFSFVVTEDQLYIAHFAFVDGVEENSVVSTEVYPNPATDKLTVTVSEPVELMEVFSNTGALVCRQTTVSDHLTIDVSMMAPGTYTIRLTTRQGVVMKKFVKER